MVQDATNDRGQTAGDHDRQGDEACEACSSEEFTACEIDIGWSRPEAWPDEHRAWPGFTDGASPDAAAAFVVLTAHSLDGSELDTNETGVKALFL